MTRRRYNFKDITGQRFARLIAQIYVGVRNGDTMWQFLCDCGAVIVARGADVKRGKIRSCGCLKKEELALRSTTHGNTVNRERSREYRAWIAMKVRCYLPNQASYSDYGARGIQVCAKWRSSFEAFRSDMGQCPPSFTLERKDVNGHYEPSNCVWATMSAQQNNRRNNRLITHNGKTQTYAQWERELGFRPGTITQRVTSYGWTPIEALRPTGSRR